MEKIHTWKEKIRGNIAEVWSVDRKRMSQRGSFLHLPNKNPSPVAVAVWIRGSSTVGMLQSQRSMGTMFQGDIAHTCAVATGNGPHPGLEEPPASGQQVRGKDWPCIAMTPGTAGGFTAISALSCHPLRFMAVGRGICTNACFVSFRSCV